MSSVGWKRIWALCRKDILESLRNRTILITLLLPLAASLLFAALDAAQVPQNFHLGVMEDTPGLERFIDRSILNMTSETVTSVAMGQDLVQQGALDAVIIVQNQEDYLVLIDSARPVKYFALTENIRLLLELYLDIIPDFYLEFLPIQQATVSQSLLPVWMTLTLTMIGVMVLSGIFAEEKDTKTMDALLISPMRRWEILWGKGLFGVLLSMGTMVFMAMLNGILTIGVSSLLWILLICFLGAVTFSSLGILIGIIAESQSAARSLGTILYLPLLFPTLIYDLSPFTQRLASFVPTFYVFRALERVLYYGGGWLDLRADLSILALMTVAIAVMTYVTFGRKMVRD